MGVRVVLGLVAVATSMLAADAAFGDGDGAVCAGPECGVPTTPVAATSELPPPMPVATVPPFDGTPIPGLLAPSPVLPAPSPIVAAAPLGDCPPPCPVPCTPPGPVEPPKSWIEVMPAHWACVERVVPPATRKVPDFDEVKVPHFEYELVDTFRTIEKPVVVTVMKPLLIPTRVPNVREVGVPVYGTAPRDHGCGCAPTPVITGVKTGLQVCGTRVVYMPAPGNPKVPTVEVRCEKQKLSTGKQWQWVRKEDRVELRPNGRFKEEPICGAPPMVVTEKVFVPCETVMVVPDPVPTPATPEEMEVWRSKRRSELGTQSTILAASEAAARLRAIQNSSLGVEAPAPRVPRPISTDSRSTNR